MKSTPPPKNAGQVGVASNVPESGRPQPGAAPSSVAMKPMRIIEVKGGAKGPPPPQAPLAAGATPATAAGAPQSHAAESRSSQLPPPPQTAVSAAESRSSQLPPPPHTAVSAAAGLQLPPGLQGRGGELDEPHRDSEPAGAIAPPAKRIESPTPLEVPVLRGSRPGADESVDPVEPVTRAEASAESLEVPIEVEGLEVDDEIGLSLEPVPTPPFGIPAVTDLADDLEIISSPGEDIASGQDVEELSDDSLLASAALMPSPAGSGSPVSAPPRRLPRTSRPDLQPNPDQDRRRQWWEELFTEEFARASLPLTAAQFAVELDFIEESLGLEQGAKVLDLGCGDGRYAAGLAQRGLQAVGLDYSSAMLSRAGERALEQPGVEFVRGDMREHSYREAFDGVICWNATFGYFDEEKNIAVLENAFNALKPGGAFLLDVPNRDMVAVHQPSQTWFEGDGCVCMDDMHLDFITSRMFVKRTMMLDDGRNREFLYAMRLYGLHELGRMLHQVGFRVVEVTGQVATPGVFFGASSPRIIVLVNKP